MSGEESGTGYSVLAFTLNLRRRMMFSTYILSIPVVFMSFLTLLVFWLPATSSDKSNLGEYSRKSLLTKENKKVHKLRVEAADSV